MCYQRIKLLEVKLTGIFATAVASDKANQQQKQKKERDNAQQYDEPASACNALLNRFCIKNKIRSHSNVHFAETTG